MVLLTLSTLSYSAATTDKQREQFLAAEAAIKADRKAEADRIIQQLGDYPLVPYLQVSQMKKAGDALKASEVEAFINIHRGSWVAQKLLISWLIQLDARGDHTNFIKFYQEAAPYTISTCRYAKALILTGQMQQAWELAPDIWLSGKSRPNQCDFLFERWKKSPNFNEEYLWDRFILARNAGQTRLATYLSNQVKSSDIKRRISLYMTIREKPEFILEPKNIDVAEPGYSALVHYGIRRLAASSPAKAESSLNYYQPRLRFSVDQNLSAVHSILKGYANQKDLQAALAFAQNLNSPLPEHIIDGVFQRAIKSADWNSVLGWIDLLSEEDAEDGKWRYWRARAKTLLGKNDPALYKDIATERSYYGFLSAMFLNQSFQFQYTPAQINADLEAGLKQRPGVQRAVELRKLGRLNNSRRAWNYAINDIPKEDRTTPAKVALDLGLYYEAIRAMAAARNWHDLSIRFPLAYREHYEKSAVQQSVGLSWIYGISRQESSFAPDIRSRSDARGLMQVLPGTAKDMARDIGVPYRASKLNEPAYNIPLGTAYLAKGLRELQNNMVYATAGYNAGINRVNRWLKADPQGLPLDMWVETIPIPETRGYVKNVMAYSVIFADKLNITSPMETHRQQFFNGVTPTP